VYSKQIHLQGTREGLPMPRLKNKWLERQKEPVAAIPVSVVAPITPSYLNIEQASAYLSVTTWTIRRLIDNKELSCAKIGKRFIVKREALDNIWEKKAEAA
jgi:excisionase family DNA binding protein